MTLPTASPFLVAGFVILAAVVVSLFVCGVAWAGVRRGEPQTATRRWTLLAVTAAAVWMALAWRVAASGILLDVDRRPPPLFVLFAAVLTMSLAIALTPLGTRLIRGLPLAALIAFQSFRLPLELLMHRAATEGVMPAQMSYSGRNLDIITGLTAAIVSLLIWRGKAGRRVATAWNVLGAALLANILVVAMISTPAIAAFGPDRLNTWVGHPPFVWLPTVFVVLATAGHLLVWRALRAG